MTMLMLELMTVNASPNADANDDDCEDADSS